MLIRLILFVVFVMGAITAFRFLRAKRLDRSGGLDVFEIDRLMKLASGSTRVKQGMALRVSIVEAAPANEKKALSAKVDGALRRLAQVEILRDRIKKALAASDRKTLTEQLDEAKVDAEIADESRAGSKKKLVEQLETQLAQLSQLSLRDDELDDVGHRLLLEMNNLHLALLNASSSEASSDTGTVATALSHLEETAESFRQQTNAEAEVDRLIRAAQKNQQLQRG